MNLMATPKEDPHEEIVNPHEEIVDPQLETICRKIVPPIVNTCMQSHLEKLSQLIDLELKQTSMDYIHQVTEQHVNKLMLDDPVTAKMMEQTWARVNKTLNDMESKVKEQIMQNSRVFAMQQTALETQLKTVKKRIVL